MSRPMLPEVEGLSGDALDAVLLDVARNLSIQLGALPGTMRLPFLVALTGFEWTALLTHARPHHALDPAARAQRVHSWGRSTLPGVRDFFRLVRSCALLHFLDHPEVRARLDAGATIA